MSRLTPAEDLSTLEASHRSLSEADWCFRQLARTDPEWLRRSSFGVFDQPNELLMFRVQPWPTFIGQDRLAEITRVSVGMSELIKAIPRRIFRGDGAALARYYELNDPRLTERLFEPPTGIEAAIGRGDFIQTDEALQCLEFNMAANLGGWETALLAQAHLEHPLTVRWLDELASPVTYTDTMRRLFDHVLAQVHRAHREAAELGDEVNVAMVVGEGGTLTMRRAFSELMSEVYGASRGKQTRGRFLICRYRDLVPRGGGVYCRGTRVDAILDVFAGPAPPSVLLAFKGGRVLMFNSPLAGALSDKRSLALLSENTDSEVFSPDERDFLAAHLPWTRRVEATRTRYGHEEVYLPEILASRRDELVLKQARLGGGKGVFVGRLVEAARWDELSRRALAEPDWVVQRYVRSIPYLYQNGEEGCSPHDVVWSPFVFGREYGGCILRMQPTADDSIVNLSLTATEGVIFELEAG